MADIFISYARRDRAIAEALDAALARSGFSVWWDASITAGDRFDEVIARELSDAKVVVVLWSEVSVHSKWVVSEAMFALEHEALVAAKIDDVKIRVPFNTVQTADLRDWDLESSHSGLREIMEGVHAKLGRRGTPKPTNKGEARISGDASGVVGYSWSTGIGDLDHAVGELLAGHVYIIAGRASMGKSALLLNLAINAARHMKKCSEQRVLLFSLEAAAEEVDVRATALLSKIPISRLRRGWTDEVENELLLRVAEELKVLPLDLEDQFVSLDQIEDLARVGTSNGPTGLIVVDGVSQIAGIAQDYRQVLARLKHLARYLKVPVVLTVDLRHRSDAEDVSPITLGDVHNGIESGADCIVAIHRDSVALERVEPREGSDEHVAWMRQMDEARPFADVLILKNRSGPIGKVRLGFDPETLEFQTLVHESSV